MIGPLHERRRVRRLICREKVKAWTGGTLLGLSLMIFVAWGQAFDSFTPRDAYVAAGAIITLLVGGCSVLIAVLFRILREDVGKLRETDVELGNQIRALRQTLPNDYVPRREISIQGTQIMDCVKHIRADIEALSNRMEARMGTIYDKLDTKADKAR